MSSVNKVILIGNLGADPEVRTTPAGKMVATISVATSESYKDAQGNKQDKSEWHRVVLWDKLAELAQRFLKKGRKVSIEGKIQTRSWDDQQTGAKRYSTEIIGREMVFIDSNRDDNDTSNSSGGYGGGGYSAPSQSTGSVPTQTTQPKVAPGFDVEDVPF